MEDIDVLAQPSADGLMTREAGPWVLDKLGIIACYAREFAAASQQARRWYYVDGFAGPGVLTLRGSGRRVPGAPLIALRTEPEFRRCVMLERNRLAAEALHARTAVFGDRAVVERGSVDEELVQLMYTHVARTQPCLCVFDTEGEDLHWVTVEAVADFKRGGEHKAEQLIILPTDTGFLRELPLGEDPPELAEPGSRAIFGNDGWRDIYVRRRGGAITPDEARTEYVRLYAGGLRKLGYATVLGRPILRHGRTGPVLYFLILATDNRHGRSIMNHCFETAFGNEPTTRPQA